MSKSSYKTCMVGKMRAIPKGIPKEERKEKFCEGAKLCSGKASTIEEAKRQCALPKPPKAPKAARSKHVYYDPDDGPPQIPDGYEIAGGAGMEI